MLFKGGGGKKERWDCVFVCVCISVWVCASGRHMKRCQTKGFDETAVGNGRRMMRQWVTHHFVLHLRVCVHVCACVCACACDCVSHTGPSTPGSLFLNSNRNHLVFLKHLWQTLASCSSPQISSSLQNLACSSTSVNSSPCPPWRLLFGVFIRLQILTSGGLDKLETHWAHQPICETKGRLKRVIYLIYNKRKQPRSQGRTER